MAVSIDYLQTFVDLFKTLSFSKTAENLEISEATVSYRIRELEKFFNKDLFIRHRDKSVSTTEFSDELYRETSSFLSTLDRMRGHEQIESKNSEIIVSTGEIAAIYLLPSAIKSFEDKFPSTEIKVEIKSSSDTILSVINKTSDIGFVISLNFPELKEELEKVKIVRLMPIELVVIAPLDHPILSKNTITVREIIGNPYISRKQTSGVQAEIKKVLEDENLSEKDLNPIYEFDNSYSVINAVSEGLGISISTSVQANKYVESGMIGKVSLASNSTAYIYFLDSYNGSNARVNNFLSHIKYYLKSTPKHH